jgi:hypothetical protein
MLTKTFIHIYFSNFLHLLLIPLVTPTMIMIDCHCCPSPPPAPPSHEGSLPPLACHFQIKTAPWDAFVVVGTFPGFKAGPPPSTVGAASPALPVLWPLATAAAVARWAAQVSAISATPLMQEQLKITDFWSQLDVDNGEDDNEGDPWTSRVIT